MAWAVHDTAVYVAVDVTDTNVVTDTAEAGSEDGHWKTTASRYSSMTWT
jgi:hypothetical protein